MNVTGGKYKGHKIKTPAGNDVRPTSSKVRASIFNVLQGLLDDFGQVKMLDLFSGSGIMGIEALSRNSGEVYFVDKNPKSIKMIKENLSKYDGNYNVIFNDAIKVLENLRGRQFNLIFIDPPYFENLYSPVLEKISQNKLLSRDGVIVLERSCDINIEDELEKNSLSLIKTKKYGTTCIDYKEEM